jgi:hypothetical protein
MVTSAKAGKHIVSGPNAPWCAFEQESGSSFASERDLPSARDPRAPVACASSMLARVAVLARVTEDLEQPRGPDVLHAVEVPISWFAEGACIEVRLPRLLSCARCEGGGCDLCGRRGAFEQAASGAPSEIAVTLPAQAPEATGPVRLRLPAHGARAAEDSGLPNGHLLLTVVPRPIEQTQVSPSVRKLPTSITLKPDLPAWIWAVLRALIKFRRWLKRFTISTKGARQ